MGALEGERNLLLDEGQQWKARVCKVEGTTKETLEYVDKLQAYLDEANAAKASLETKAKAVQDQVFELQWQVQALQAQV